MKKITWGVFVVFCAVNMSGCAIPEKSIVSPPSSKTSSGQSLPVYSQDGGDPGSLEQPKYLDIEDQQPDVVDKSIDTVLPSMEYVNERIFEYGRKLDRWKELDRQSVNMKLKEEDAVQMVHCFRNLQNVLNGYSELRNELLQADTVDVATRIGNEEILELQKNDIAFLENSCGSLLADSEDKSAGWSQREDGADLTQIESLIDRYATKKDYEAIIQMWMQIPKSQLGQLHVETKILYGNALMYLHQEEKAAEIYQLVVKQMSDSDEQSHDLVSLRKMLADLYTASGNYSMAASEYKKISEDYLKIGELEEWSKLQLSLLDRAQKGSPELKEYSAMLRNFLGFIPERDGYKIAWQAEKFQTNYPYSLVTSNVDIIKESVIKAADKWFNGFMGKVDKLGNEKKFAAALKLLETMPTDIIDVEKQLVLKAKNEELLMAEAVENETGKMARIQDLQNQWNNGMLLANGDRYEEAVTIFTSLLGTEYSQKAEAKIKELSLEGAKKDRRKAADLFMRFTKTTDQESRKRLLVESRKLLKNILVKYPDVEIAPKVIGNIKRVEQEMNAIDPNLVFMADQGAVPVAREEGTVGGFAIPEPKTMMRDQRPIIETDLDSPVSQ
jgi:tetratricopeptide (TPR) repeat protein